MAAPNYDLEDIAFRVDFQLTSHGGRRGKWVIVPIASVHTNISVDQSGIRAKFIDLLSLDRIIGGVDLDALAEKVKSQGESYLNENSVANPVQGTIGEYITLGLIHLAERSHVFYELAADNENFLAKHYDPKVKVGDIETGGIDEPSVPMVKAGSLDAEALANLDKIEHIVVLMMENRSFDHMLGYLSHPDHGNRSDVDGLTRENANSFTGVGEIKVHPLQSQDFPVDLHHRHDHVMKQIAEGEMSGFLESFIDANPHEANPDLVMGFYKRGHVKTYDFLAKHFMVCDRWFSTYPGSTYPNRSYLVGGSTPTIKNLDPDDPRFGYLKQPTIFDRLTTFGVSWMYYEHDVAFLRMYDRYRLDNRNVIPIDTPDEGFWDRAARGDLPQVTFIDPAFVQSPPDHLANDDYPVHDHGLSQQLIANIYDALVGSPQWPKILFVITYDEHGGFYDHVPPPGTEGFKKEFPDLDIQVPEVQVEGETIKHLGVRVPTFVISPYVDQGDGKQGNLRPHLDH